MPQDVPLQSIFQTTVADIEPTSLHTTPVGKEPDTATVVSSLLLAEPTTSETLADALDLGAFRDPVVEVSEDGLLAHVTGRQQLERTGDDRYRLHLQVPHPPAELVKNGDFSVVVLLPRAAVYSGVDLYEVALESYTREPEPLVFGQGAVPAIGGRIALAWYARQDPEIDVEYWIRRLMG